MGKKSGGQVEKEVKQTMEQIELESIAKQIQVILGDKFGIQPFLQFDPSGVIPNVRLIKLQKKDEQVKEN